MLELYRKASKIYSFNKFEPPLEELPNAETTLTVINENSLKNVFCVV